MYVVLLVFVFIAISTHWSAGIADASSPPHFTAAQKCTETVWSDTKEVWSSPIQDWQDQINSLTTVLALKYGAGSIQVSAFAAGLSAGGSAALANGLTAGQIAALVPIATACGSTHPKTVFGPAPKPKTAHFSINVPKALQKAFSAVCGKKMQSTSVDNFLNNFGAFPGVTSDYFCKHGSVNQVLVFVDSDSDLLTSEALANRFGWYSECVIQGHQWLANFSLSPKSEMLKDARSFIKAGGSLNGACAPASTLKFTWPGKNIPRALQNALEVSCPVSEPSGFGPGYEGMFGVVSAYSCYGYGFYDGELVYFDSASNLEKSLPIIQKQSFATSCTVRGTNWVARLSAGQLEPSTWRVQYLDPLDGTKTGNC
jgi:hypothetical protein